MSSAAEGELQAGENAGRREPVATHTHNEHGREPGAGMDVVIDHDLQGERCMMKQSNWEQDHQHRDDGRSHPGEEGGVVATCTVVRSAQAFRVVWLRDLARLRRASLRGQTVLVMRASFTIHPAPLAKTRRRERYAADVAVVLLIIRIDPDLFQALIFTKASPLCIAMCSVLLLLISYCGSSAVA